MMLWLAVALTGCCSWAPQPSKYFDISWDARDCMRKFQYAVETGYYDEAYDCLTEASKEQFSRTRFKLFLKLGGELGEQFQDVEAWEIIVNSSFVQLTEDRVGKRAAVQLFYDDSERDITVSQWFLFVGRSPEDSDDPMQLQWFLDLKSTLDLIVGGNG